MILQIGLLVLTAWWNFPFKWEQNIPVYKPDPKFGFIGPFRYQANFKNPCWRQEQPGTFLSNYLWTDDLYVFMYLCILLLLFHIMDVWVFICWYFFRPQLLIDQNESIG